MNIIGIDGGATKINGWQVIYDEKTKLFSLGEQNIQKRYAEYEEYIPGFKPVDISVQLSQMKDNIQLTPEEKRHSKAYIKAAADVIHGLIKENKDKTFIGFGMPGLKTADKRGIVALANGPRMPFFLEEIEAILKERKSNFHPVRHLGSDADYCGMGEEYAADGLFRDVQNAYYLGGGTGVADALKLHGKLLSFDNAKDWIAKAWEMKSKTGLSLERYASAGGIQYIYSNYTGMSIEKMNKNHVFPPQILQAAIAGEKEAISTMNDVSENIADLLFERIWTIYNGWAGQFEFINKNKPALNPEHPYKSVLLDRIVIGQRLGDLISQSKSGTFLWYMILDKLTKSVKQSKDSKFKNHYLKEGKFDDSMLTISKLREAPVIGAAVDAFLNI